MLKVPAMKITCEAHFDGKEVAVEGPDHPYRAAGVVLAHRALHFPPGAES